MISKKIKKGEIYYYSDTVDRTVIHTGSDVEIKKQRKLLKHKVEVLLYKIDQFFDTQIHLEKSKFTKLKLDFYPIPQHLITKFQKINPKGKFKSIKAQPTMSFRTVWITFQHFHCFAKFDYPFSLGGVKRILSLVDGAYSLYVSDSLRENWRHQKILQPIWDEYFLYSDSFKNYRVLLRQDDYLYKSNFILPLASFINAKIKKEKSLNSIEIFQIYIEKILTTYIDISLKLYREGISLESHGQNLLVECENEETLRFTGKLYYRDFSVVALCRELREKAGILSSVEKKKIFALPQISREFLENVIWKKFYVDLPSAFLYPFVAYKPNDKTNQMIYAKYFSILKVKLKRNPKFKSILT